MSAGDGNDLTALAVLGGLLGLSVRQPGGFTEGELAEYSGVPLVTVRVFLDPLTGAGFTEAVLPDETERGAEAGRRGNTLYQVRASDRKSVV